MNIPSDAVKWPDHDHVRVEEKPSIELVATCPGCGAENHVQYKCQFNCRECGTRFKTESLDNKHQRQLSQTVINALPH